MNAIEITCCSATDLSGAMIKKYLKIMDKIDPDNSDFQKHFNGFYMVRRNEQWREAFYHIFSTEYKKKDRSSFENLLRCVLSDERIGRMEYSFTSKMLHTLCPEKPIWDKNVLEEIGIAKIPSNWNTSEKIQRAIEIYGELESAYNDHLKTEDCKKQIEMFDSVFPDAKSISPVKKIDFLLWKQNALKRKRKEK